MSLIILNSNIMHTVQLNVQDSAYNHFMKFLGTFKNNEINLISDIKPDFQNPTFLKNKAELHETLRRIEAGEATLLTQEEFEDRLNNCI
jgi:hypothetical protein